MSRHASVITASRVRVWRVLLGALLLVATAGCASVLQEPPIPAADAPAPIQLPAGSLVIRNVTVIDGTGAPPLLDTAVAVYGGRIWAVRPVAELAIPMGATVINMDGGTLLPGIINAHVRTAEQTLVRRLFLLDGVTTVCDIGAPLEALPDFAADRIQIGQIARVARSGPLLVAPGSPPRGPVSLYPVGEPTGAQAATAELLAADADLIEIASLDAPLDPASAEAIVAEAHAQGIVVRAQAASGAALQRLLDAGADVVDGLAPDAWQAAPLPADLSPQMRGVAGRQGILVSLVEANCASPANGADRQACEDGYLASVRRFAALGGTIALGNGYGTQPAIKLGMPLGEMALLQRAGLTPMQIIQAATQTAAVACGRADALGTVQPGKAADLIVVDGDPLSDLQVLDRVRFVMVDGNVVLATER